MRPIIIQIAGALGMTVAFALPAFGETSKFAEDTKFEVEFEVEGEGGTEVVCTIERRVDGTMQMNASMLKRSNCDFNVGGFAERNAAFAMNQAMVQNQPVGANVTCESAHDATLKLSGCGIAVWQSTIFQTALNRCTISSDSIASGCSLVESCRKNLVLALSSGPSSDSVTSSFSGGQGTFLSKFKTMELFDEKVKQLGCVK